jgi:hypothetical protein
MQDNLESRISRRGFLSRTAFAGLSYLAGLGTAEMSAEETNTNTNGQDPEILEVGRSFTFQLLAQNIRHIGNLAAGKRGVYFISGNSSDNLYLINKLANIDRNGEKRPVINTVYRIEHTDYSLGNARLRTNSRGELFVFESLRDDTGTLYKFSPDGKLVSKLEGLSFKDKLGITGRIADMAINPLDNQPYLLIKNLGLVVSVDFDRKTTRPFFGDLYMHSELIFFDGNGSLYVTDRFSFDPPGERNVTKTNLTKVNKGKSSKVEILKPSRISFFDDAYSFFLQEGVYDPVGNRFLLAGSVSFFKAGFGEDYVFSVDLKSGEPKPIARAYRNRISGIDVDFSGNIYLALASPKRDVKYGKVVVMTPKKH